MIEFLKYVYNELFCSRQLNALSKEQLNFQEM